MRQLALSVLLVATTGLFVTGAFAQSYGGYRDNPYSRGDRNYRGDRYRGDGYRGGDIVDRTFADLQQTASASFYARHERGHFDHAMRELSKFQNKRARGKFDHHALDEAIGEMSRLSRAGELNPRVRETMARDADELRVFRAGGYDNGGFGSDYRH
jgi:hypothetical protein